MISIQAALQILVAEGWIPSKRVDEVQEVLRDACVATNAQTHTIMELIRPTTQPPTHYNTNKFTAGFQLIVEAYGVARYREVRRLVPHDVC